MSSDDASFTKIAEHVKLLIAECALEANSTNSELTTNIKGIIKSLTTPIDNSLKSFENLHCTYYYEVLSRMFVTEITNARLVQDCLTV